MSNQGTFFLSKKTRNGYDYSSSKGTMIGSILLGQNFSSNLRSHIGGHDDVYGTGNVGPHQNQAYLI